MDSTSSGGPPLRHGRGPAVDPQWLPIGLAAGAVVLLALVPLAYLVWQGFRVADAGTGAPGFTLAHLRALFDGPNALRMFRNSLVFGVGTAAFALALGTTLAWMNERLDMPMKRLFFALSIVPLIVPGVLFTVAWILLGSPRIGLVNLVLQSVLRIDSATVDIYSMGGMIFVDGLHYSPVAFLLMSAAFRSMDPSLEESAAMSGANALETAWHITGKLACPAIFATLLILFVRAIGSFEVPALLGLPAGIDVYTSAIYRAVHEYPSNVGLAAAYALVLLALTTAGIGLHARLSRRQHRYATTTGKGLRARAIDVGRWRYLATAVFVLYLTLVVVLPFLVLLWSSFQPYYRAASTESASGLSLDAYRYVFDYPAIRRAGANSLLLSISAATIVMLLTSVIAWTVVRTRIPGRWVLDVLTSVPLGVPGLVLGLAIMVFYLNVPLGLYGTVGILLIAYVTRFMPYGLRYNMTSMLRIHRELEESAAMSGASWSETFRGIVLPLLKPGILAGWIYVAIVSVRELSTSILLYSPGSEVVSVVIWELWENGQYPELSALGVLLILALLGLVVLAQRVAPRFGVTA